MRFMMIIYPNEQAEAGVMPTAQEVSAMMVFNKELIDSGKLLSADGLHPSSRGARVRFKDGKPTVTDGPFTQTREVLGGYWIIQVDSKEEAIEWAKRVPLMDDQSFLELRQIFDPEDFPADVRKAAGYES